MPQTSMKEKSPSIGIKQNCWEFKNCGREPGGKNALEMGICPAADTKAVHGINGGKNGGRACWAIAGTMCSGKVQGIFVQKLMSCRACDFYSQVSSEEGDKLVDARGINDAIVASL